LTAPAYANSLLNTTDGHHLVDTQQGGSKLVAQPASSLCNEADAAAAATATIAQAAAREVATPPRPGTAPPGVPGYLTEVYNWAYVSPRALHVFERQWLVNAILFGNYRTLLNAALDLLGQRLPGRTLQIACVYGDLTAEILKRVPAGEGRLSVVDVLPQQLANLRHKLAGVAGADQVEMLLGDSSALPVADASMDRALLFFLLHEQPEAVRRGTLANALRVLKPGGRLVVVDYHRPRAWHPLHLPMRAVLATLEPYALDLWGHEIEHWMPADAPVKLLSRRTHFAGLYQIMEFERA
jgi:ubiquinone/menaquinone biosynthesis C-methylase UbiE